MAAVLERNDPSGKPTVLPEGMEHSEVVKCEYCHTSFTLAYGAAEIRMQAGRLVPELMREKAIETVAGSHPIHEVEMYVWGGIEKGWLDREQATAAGM
jgi:hypothetical protein